MTKKVTLNETKHLGGQNTGQDLELPPAVLQDHFGPARSDTNLVLLLPFLDEGNGLAKCALTKRP